MVLESLLTTIGIESLKEALRSLKSKLSEREYKALVREAVAELLKEHPDIDAAEAKILAAEATRTKPSVELIRAKSALQIAKVHYTKKHAAKKYAPKKYATKKITKRVGKPKSLKKIASRYIKKH